MAESGNERGFFSEIRAFSELGLENGALLTDRRRAMSLVLKWGSPSRGDQREDAVHTPCGAGAARRLANSQALAQFGLRINTRVDQTALSVEGSCVSATSGAKIMYGVK
ncbi:hypothetical protein Bbelb_152270 [Branchiostoma belcheri]|nr:hypothetical protein Bbelb_152270 [Branchiostoma belcheri]